MSLFKKTYANHASNDLSSGWIRKTPKKPKMRQQEIPNAHCIELAEFLNKPAGLSLMQALMNRRPPISGNTLEQKAMSGSVSEGWEKCTEEILNIAEERPEGTDLGQSKFINPADDNDPKKKPQGKV
jgi:hypothetical protein